MNLTKWLTSTIFAFALLASPAFAADKDAPCCAKAKKEGKDCTHGECCVDAKKNNTVCEKCGGKKDDKKKS